MSVFRCYMTGSDGHFRDFVSLEAASDLDAVTRARVLTAAHSGFELWEGARLVHREVAAPAMPIKVADDPITAPFGTGVKAVLRKLEQFAASIGETLPGVRLLAVARPKDKRRGRN